MTPPIRSTLLACALATAALLGGLLADVGTTASASGEVTRAAARATYANPVINLNTADVSVTYDRRRGQYVLVSSSLPWGDEAPPGLRGHQSLPVFTSRDMVHWRYRHQLTFDAGPGQAAAPYLTRIGGRWLLYFAMFTQDRPGSRIRVATTSGDPAGNGWSLSPRTVVPRSRCRNEYGTYCLTIGPSVITDGDHHYLYYGSFRGGIKAVELSPDGLHRRAHTTHQIGHAARYEATDVVRHGGYYYLFSSTAPCCQGPTTAYSVVVNRSRHWDGPFRDRLGVPMVRRGLITGDYGGQGGGEPFLKPHGDRWQGVGSNTLVTDAAGHDWTYYYGVDTEHGFVNGLDVARHSTKDQRATYRQTLLDRVTWTDDGWPVVNGGRGPSTGPMPVPTTRMNPGDPSALPVVPTWIPPTPGAELPDYSTTFADLPPTYGWVHHTPRLVGLAHDRLTIRGKGDLAGGVNTARNLLVTPEPDGAYVMETRLAFDPNQPGQQAGLVVYGDDDHYLKLVKAKNRSLTLALTARETLVRDPTSRRGLVPCPFHHGSYDATSCPSFGEEWGYPANLTRGRNGTDPRRPRASIWLRIYRSGTTYAMWSSDDGQVWHQLNTWRLGGSDGPVRIGMLTIGHGGRRPIPARFDYLRVSRYP